MIDPDAEIRQTVFEWAEAAPMAPTVDDLEGASPMARPRRPARLLVVAAAVVLVLVAVAVVVSARTSGPQPSTVQSIPGPIPATFDDVAGQVLAARFGVTPSGGYELTGEWGRDAALTAADGTLPTGPLGPVYAQALDLGGEDSASSVAVVTVLPTEQDDVVVAATGHDDGTPVTVAGRSATYVAAWSGDDASAVTWQQDGVAVVVVGRSALDQDALVAFAAQAAPVPDPPILPVGPEEVELAHPDTSPASWSLAPEAPRPATSVSPEVPMHWNGWFRMRAHRAVVLALSTVVAHGRDELGPFTVRAMGQPDEGGSLYPGGTATRLDGTPAWDTAENLRVETRGIDGQRQDLVEGMGPASVVQVRVHLSDGQTFMGPTYDVGRGWPVRLFAVSLPGMHTDPVPGGLHVVRIDGIGPDGELIDAGLASLGNGAGDGVDTGMVGPCHPADPTAFVFTDLCQGG